MTEKQEETKKSIMDFFPLEEARKSQKIVIEEIDKVFKSGKKIIILEAPVGSGKSAIAVTFARQAGALGSHVITPKKTLQDQYFSDFSDDLVLMKGRNAYPCTFDAPAGYYSSVVKAINTGKIKQPDKYSANCAEAPCRDSAEIYKECTQARECPYNLAIRIAQEHDIVVHNLHSFIFQSSFAGKFEKRPLLIIDEAHEIENTIRDFVTKKISLNGNQTPNCSSLKEWVDYFLQPEFVPKESTQEIAKKQQDKAFKSEKDKWIERVRALEEKDYFSKGYSVNVVKTTKPGQSQVSYTTFEFVPHYVGGAVNSMLLAFGDRVLLMSGTIYNKELYCKNLGINMADSHFIRVGSSFPKENRPIYVKPEYQINTSHASWNDNFADLIGIVQKISNIFHDVKGLIHAPSYVAAEQIKNALNSDRYITHSTFDFQEKLEDFFKTKDNRIFISPVCQQGVDFKQDRARFQIVVRIPYLNTSNKFVEDKVESDFPWYNYQALIVFGQQIGRVNRSEDDYGATFLVDSRFNAFLKRNGGLLPSWVKESFIYK